jgi:cytoskeleton protein RodZ
LPSFGEKLKQEREKRKITLEQISVSTKIGTRMLQALEEDKFNQLPGGIFNKGFVRAYSRFVGLDEDQTVAEYLQASGDIPPVATEVGSRSDGMQEVGVHEPAANVDHIESGTEEPARQLPWGWFAAVLLVAALALSLWSNRRREHTTTPAPPSTPAATTPMSGGGSNAASGEGNTGSSASSSNNASATPLPTSNVKPAPASVAGGKAASVSLNASQSSVTQNAANAPAAPGEFTVAIQAREESWVSITADGKARSSELLATGNERAIRGRKEIIIKVGNAGGVDFRFNGKKLETGGEFGEVKTVTFGPGGLVPNAPAPTTTP